MLRDIASIPQHLKRVGLNVAPQFSRSGRCRQVTPTLGASTWPLLPPLPHILGDPRLAKCYRAHAHTVTGSVASLCACAEFQLQQLGEKMMPRMGSAARRLRRGPHCTRADPAPASKHRPTTRSPCPAPVAGRSSSQPLTLAGPGRTSSCLISDAPGDHHPAAGPMRQPE